MVSPKKFLITSMISLILVQLIACQLEIEKDELTNKKMSITEEEKNLLDSTAPKPPGDPTKPPKEVTFGFFHAFVASMSVIIVSEIGDKTFFIAAIMAMKHPRMTVYIGAIFALGLMTLLSAVLGNIITQFIPKIYTFYASTFLFAIFGLKMLHEGYHMSPSDQADEYEEANQELKETEEKNENYTGDKDIESGQASNNTGPSRTHYFTRMFRKYFSAIFLQAFVLTFLAEWGDRSQISTIILGARENVFGTVIGGTLGHGLCTAAAVIGGSFLAKKISVKTVTLVGAVVFLLFAFSALFVSPDSL